MLRMIALGVLAFLLVMMASGVVTLTFELLWELFMTGLAMLVMMLMAAVEFVVWAWRKLKL